MSEERVRYDGKLVGPPGTHELLRLVPRIRAVLGAVQWAGTDLSCPICLATERHVATCELAALLDAMGT